MAFRLVSSAGSVTDAAMVNMPASGTIYPGGVVAFERGTNLSNGYVYPATSSTTQTQIFGIAYDYREGVSDVNVTVLPFCPGQLWEADCINVVTTAQIGKKFQFATGTTRERNTYILNTSYDQSGMTGIFMCWQITSTTTGSGKIIGEFIRNNASVGLNSTTFN